MRYPPEKAQPYLFHQLLQLAKSLGYALALLMTARFLFVALHGELVELKRNPGVTLDALVLGLRFDLMSASYLAAPAFLVTALGFIWPREEVLRGISWFNRSWCFLGLVALALVIWCDLSFYGHFQDHLNLIFISHLKTDPADLFRALHRSTSLLVWGPLLVGFALLTWWLLGRWFRVPRIDLFYARPMPAEEVAVFLTAGVVLLVFFARGNFHRAPLSIDEAFASDFPTANELSINGVLALRRAIRVAKKNPFADKRQLSLQGYQQISDAVADVKAFHGETAPATGWTGLNDLLQTTGAPEDRKPSTPHVVVFVAHNLSLRWAREGVDILQELRNWSASALVFERILVADQNPGKNMEALLSGLPSRPETRPLSEGEFMRTRLASSVQLPFQRAGYQTRFLNAQFVGHRSLGSYLSAQGWDKVEGVDQISERLNLWSMPENEREDDHGLFDESVYRYVLDELQRAQRPQLIVVQLASGRPPFRVPASFRDKGPLRLLPGQQKLFGSSAKETSQYIRAMEYVSSRFVGFHNELTQLRLAENTVVAFTSDVTHWPGRVGSGSPEIARWSAPLFIQLPGDLKPKTAFTGAWGTHVDIFPTLFELILPRTSYWSFGRNLLRTKGLALSTGHIAVGTSGAYVNGQAYCWSSAGGSEHLEECASLAVTKDLAAAWKGSVSLADEYLRSAALGQIGLLP